MKIKVLSLTSLALMLSTSCVYTKGVDGIKGSDGISNILSDSGSGEITEKKYTFDFDEIQVSTGLNAEIMKSNKEEIVVFAPDDLMKFVSVKLTGRKVTIKIESEGFKNISTERIRVKIYAKDFNQLVASSSGNVIIKDNFDFSDLDIKVSSSGSIKGKIKGDNINIQNSSSGSFDGEILSKSLNVQASSSADINITGKVMSANIQASSSGDVDAENLTAEIATLTASSSSDITIGVSEKVNASASSSADINVLKKGNLSNVSKNESSSGSVTIR